MILNYLNDTTEYKVSFKRLSENIVEIKGNFPIETAGFTLSREDHEDNWHYSDYTTVYKEIDGGVQFSNDGSVYVEPEPVEYPELDEEYVAPLTLNEVNDKVDILTDCVLEMSTIVYE